MARVLVINGSPKMEKGETAMVLAPFLQGIEGAGASVDLLYTKKLKIKPCLGEFHCWWEKIGECIQKDDMQAIYEKFKGIDTLVIATPVYFPLPGELQNLFNRLMPLIEPVLEFRDGRTRPKLHRDVKFSKLVLVGTSGWWELQNLDIVVDIVKHIAAVAGVEFCAPVLRPHAYIMKENGEKAKKVMEALKEAGRQLVKQGSIQS